MAEKDPENGPSLELPSLFGRRKRSGEQPDDEPGGRVDTVVEQQPPTAHTPAVTPTAVPTPTPTPAPEPEPEPEPAPAPAPVEPPTKAEVAPPAEAPAEPAPPRTRPWQRGATASEPSAPPKKAPGGRRRARTSGRSIPELAASTAALVVGALVGLVGCVLTFFGLKGCELFTGTDSCGGPGLLILVAILVAMVLLGAVVLRALRVSEAGNISFLGVGIMTVVALLFFADSLYDPWMFVVVPVVTALSFGIARWITTRYAEDVLEDTDDRPHYDVR